MSRRSPRPGSVAGSNSLTDTLQTGRHQPTHDSSPRLATHGTPPISSRTLALALRNQLINAATDHEIELATSPIWGSLDNPWRMGHRPSPVIRSTFPLIVTT